MKLYPRVMLSLTVVLLLVAGAAGWCGSPIRDGDPGTIGACLALCDGSKVSLPGEQVVWRGRSGKSFAIKEYFEATPSQPRIVVASTRSLSSVQDTWTVDVTGTLSTISGTSKDGGSIRQRVLIVSPENVSVYCDPKGRPMMFPPVKAFGMEWGHKRTLAELSGASTIRSASISAMDAGGLPLMDDSPDSEPTPPAAGSRDSLKWLPDGTHVHLRNRLAAASNYPTFCIEEPDRTGSIRVNAPNTYSINAGDLVEIQGTLTTIGGEKVVQADFDDINYVDLITVIDTGCVTPTPLGLTNKAVGGGAVGPFTPAVGSSTGINNTGMLARIWGKVTVNNQINPNGYWYYCIDDGSGIVGSGGTLGVRVYSGNQPSVGTYNSATGFIGCEIPDGSTTSVPTLFTVTYNYPTYSTGSGTISGTITADASAAGMTTRIHGTCGSMTCVLNSSGVGTYSLTAKPGSHTVSVDLAGYTHGAAKATVTANQTTTKNFSLTPIGKEVYVYSSVPRIPPDGSARRLSQQSSLMKRAGGFRDRA